MAVERDERLEEERRRPTTGQVSRSNRRRSRDDGESRSSGRAGARAEEMVGRVSGGMLGQERE